MHEAVSPCCVQSPFVDFSRPLADFAVIAGTSQVGGLCKLGGVSQVPCINNLPDRPKVGIPVCLA